MYITLLFDAEDLVDPRSDDATLRIAQIFAEEGAPSTFMVVGEKARLWEQRDRRDIVAALQPHDIGLHTNRHSIHPTVAEYLEGKSWDRGIEEVLAQERPGVQDLLRIFGRMPSCWGRGGSTWGPQVAPALRLMNVPAMMYSFTHLGEPRHRLHYFCGVLSYYWDFGGFDAAFSDDQAFEAAWSEAVEHIGQCVLDGVEWLGLFVCHPTTVRATVFWDRLNFYQCVNTPPEQWRLPEYRSDAEWEVAQRNLRRLASQVGRIPGVTIRTVHAVNQLATKPPTMVPVDELARMAQAAALSQEIESENPLLSPAEALYLWALWLESSGEGCALPYHYVEGPSEEPMAQGEAASISAESLRCAARTVLRAVDSNGRLPANVRLGQAELGIGTIYRALAAACAGKHEGDIQLLPGPQVPAVGDILRQEVMEGVPGWMHKPDLDVSQIATYTRLQSWTLKPAVLS